MADQEGKPNTQDGETGQLRDDQKQKILPGGQAPGGPMPIHPGFILSIFFLIFVIVDIFLCGFQYRVADMRWSKIGPYRVIGVLELTQVIFAFLVAIFGLFSFKTFKGLGAVSLRK
ncbi:MAG: hypothetical protein MJ252_05565 [archaeon]|nr:hypothetical protein [archaeon]